MATFGSPRETWDARYAEPEYLFGEAPNAFVRRTAPRYLAAGQSALCVADGEGRNSVWLAGRGLDVEAFDISDVGVAKARALAAEQGVSVNFAVSDCDAYAWTPGAYDGVAAIFVQFADPAMRARLFANLIRCLKPGGTLVLQAYTPKQLDSRTGGHPHVSHLYKDADSLTKGKADGKGRALTRCLGTEECREDGARPQTAAHAAPPGDRARTRRLGRRVAYAQGACVDRVSGGGRSGVARPIGIVALERSERR